MSTEEKAGAVFQSSSSATKTDGLQNAEKNGMEKKGLDKIKESDQASYNRACKTLEDTTLLS